MAEQRTGNVMVPVLINIDDESKKFTRSDQIRVTELKVERDTDPRATSRLLKGAPPAPPPPVNLCLKASLQAQNLKSIEFFR